MNSLRQKNAGIRPVSNKLLLIFALLLFIGVIELVLIWQQLADIDTANTNSPFANAEKSNSQAFDKTKHPTIEASSLWAVVNKGRSLPADYVPELVVPPVTLRNSPSSNEMKLRPDAAKAMETMFAAAAKDKILLRLSSGYRSYDTQRAIYNREVRTYGQTQADRQSARPGHSEHQTGLAADISPKDGRCDIADCFADTDEGKWLAKNAYKFGFILRYPKGKDNLTGYKYESWHFRYVGKELAKQIYNRGQTLEQFFNLPNYTSYPATVFKLN